MKATPKKTVKRSPVVSKTTTGKKQPAALFQPGIVTFLIALIAVLTLILLAYFGVIFS